MLKRKRDLCYRKAITRWERCKYCAHREWTPIYKIGSNRSNSLNGVNGSRPRYEWRCAPVGLDSSRRYGIQMGHVCNEYKKGRESP